MRSRTIVALCSILILAACGGDEPQNDEALFDPAASITNPMPEPATAPEVAAGTTIMVSVNDGHIATRESAIPVGPAVLTVSNVGQEVHGLHVEGPGVQGALEGTIAANESGTINVTFRNGEYTLYCPILDHRKKGETLTMTIPTQQ